MAARRPYEKRALQVVKYLEKHFPTPYPVELKFVPFIPLEYSARKKATKRELERGDYGITEWDGSKKRIVIKLSRRLCSRNVSLLLETLLHEWAHCMTMPNYRVWCRTHHHMPHPPAWGLAYAEIYSTMLDAGGLTESKAIEV